MSVAESCMVNQSGPVWVFYHPIEDHETARDHQTARVDVFSSFEMHIHHNHPSPVVAVKLFNKLLKEGNFSKAQEFITAVNNCSTSMCFETGRRGPYEIIDTEAFRKISKNDSKLHDRLLDLYQKALEDKASFFL